MTRLCVLGWLISFLLNSFLLCAQSISCSPSLTLSLSLCKHPQAPDGSCRGWGLLYLPLRGLPFVFGNLSLNPPIKTSYGSRLTNPSCLTICSPNPTTSSLSLNPHSGFLGLLTRKDLNLFSSTHMVLSRCLEFSTPKSQCPVNDLLLTL